MRIAISADGPSLDAKVGERFGTSKYLLIVDPESGEFETVVNPGAASLRYSGIQAVVTVISKKPDVLLTGYLSPTAEKHLTANGIRVVRGASGPVPEALEQLQQTIIKKAADQGNAPARPAESYRDRLILTLKSSGRQFGSALPVMMGVVLLLGLFHAFVGLDAVASFFSGHGVWDTLQGAVAGSFFAGNPITSYIIGGELLAQGGSLFAVTAFLVTWVTVGLLQLPAEIDALGMRFAMLRNGLSFVASLCIAGVTVAACRLLAGGCP
ncbi:MAG: NifB/NifX family molybdenum-iron cluster-binding protein [Deltaproteobacteria bacterium]|nr:NifB/NifX family molybdenum-iron cluster-binding protein [Deltaproteobacteria bacterium]